MEKSFPGAAKARSRQSHLLSGTAACAGAGAGRGHVAAGPVEVAVVRVVALPLAEVVEQLPQVVVVRRLEEVCKEVGICNTLNLTPGLRQN